MAGGVAYDRISRVSAYRRPARPGAPQWRRCPPDPPAERAEDAFDSRVFDDEIEHAREAIAAERNGRALREIPVGATVTYSELARRIGRPESVRAVAAACGANPIAVIVPCHRVIGKDGSLTGYAWGVEKKRMLLEREKSRSA